MLVNKRVAIRTRRSAQEVGRQRLGEFILKDGEDKDEMR